MWEYYRTELDFEEAMALLAGFCEMHLWTEL